MRTSVLLIFAISLAACGATPTELVVVVDSDLQAPTELAVVRALMKDPQGTPVALNDFHLDERSLPFSFVVVPANGDLERTITIDLIAYAPDRTALFTRTSQTRFLSERRLKLPMFLAEQCTTLAPSCAGGSTCTELGCAPAARSPGELQDVEPGEELAPG